MSRDPFTSAEGRMLCFHPCLFVCLSVGLFIRDLKREITRCRVVADDLSQAFASVDDEMQEGRETHASEAVPFQQQFSSIPASTSQAEAYPPGTMSSVYPTGPAPSIYPPGGAPMHPSMMVGHGRDFNQARTNFQMEDHGPVYQPEQASWQSGPGNEPAHTTVGFLPSSSGVAPQGIVRPEFHPNLELGAPIAPPEENLPA